MVRIKDHSLLLPSLLFLNRIITADVNVMSIFPLILPHFIGYPLILASSTNLHVFATTLCQLTLRPTSLTFLLFTPLPVSFAHVLTTLSSVRTVSYGQRSFAYSAPSAWKRSSDSVSTFGSRTKTNLFRLVY